jgi:Flp pilus assembly pilin Flp
MLDHLQAMIAKTHSDESGQTAVEYALVLLLVALVLVTVLATGLGGALNDAVARLVSSL